MDSLLQRILNIPPVWTYLVVGLLVAAEEAMIIGLLVPGDTAAILAGVAANRGRLGIAQTLILVMLSAIVGASIGYLTGKYRGARIMQWRIIARYQSKIDTTTRFLQRYGIWALLLGRFSTIFRTMLPQLVGMSRMPYRRFVTASTAGAMVWGAVMVMAGYLVGQSVTTIARNFNAALGIALVVIVVGLVSWRWRQHRRRHAQAALSEPSDTDEDSR